MWDKPGWLDWFWQFLCEGLSSFSPERFYYSYAWSSSLCERRTSFCIWLIPRKSCRFLMFSTSFISLNTYFFFLYQSPSSSLCTVFKSISSKTVESLSINPCAYVFVFGDFTIHHKDWLTYSGGTDRPADLCYNFYISKDLTQMVNFSIWIPDCESLTVLLFWIYFFFWH